MAYRPACSGISNGMTKGGKPLLGLAISAMSLHRGQTRTFTEMRIFCVAAGEQISRERLRQIFEKALRKLRIHLARESNEEVRHALQAILHK